MILDLKALKYCFNEIDTEDLKELDIYDFQDFQNYIVENIISNLEYDFAIDRDLIDMNNFIRGEENE